MALDLPHGPWNKIVSGKWSGYSVALYSNSSRHLLFVLFDEPAPDRVQGMLVLLRKAFRAEGDLHKFILAQRQDLTVYEKVSRAGRQSWLLLSGTPAYVPYSVDELSGALQDQYAELEGLSKAVESVGRDFGLKLTELSAVSEEQATDLLGDPFTLFALVNPAAERERGPVEIGREPVGKTAEGAVVELSLGSLAGALVIGPREKRKPVLRLLVENALKNGLPALLFTSTAGLADFDKLNPRVEELRKAGLSPLPVGFVFKPFKLGQGVFVDLRQVDAEAFLECFDLQRAEVGNVLRRAFEEKGLSVTSLSDLVAAIKGLKESKDASAYQINKTIRLLGVVSALYSGLFGRNVVPELAQLALERSGKAVRLDVSGYPQSIQRLFMHSIVKTIQPFRGAKVLRGLIVFEMDAGPFQEVIALARSKLGESVGVIACGEHDVDLAFFKNPLLIASVLEKEVVLQEAGQKPSRVTLRPAWTSA